MFLTRILTATRLEERPHGLQSIWLQGDHAAAGPQVAYAREENAAILVNCEDRPARVRSSREERSIFSPE